MAGACKKFINIFNAVFVTLIGAALIACTPIHLFSAGCWLRSALQHPKQSGGDGFSQLLRNCHLCCRNFAGHPPHFRRHLWSARYKT
jgi:hypothetical protein